MRDKIKSLLKSRKTKVITIVLICVLTITFASWQIFYPIVMLKAANTLSYLDFRVSASETVHFYQKCERYYLTHFEACLREEMYIEETDSMAASIIEEERVEIDDKFAFYLPYNWEEYDDDSEPYYSPYYGSEFRLNVHEHRKEHNSGEDIKELKVKGAKKCAYWIDKRVDFKPRRVSMLVFDIETKNGEERQFTFEFNRLIIDPEDAITRWFNDMEVV